MGGSNSTFSYENQLANDKSHTYSIEVAADGEKYEARSIPRRHPTARESLLYYPYPNEKDVNPEGGYRTLWESFQRSVKKWPENKCLGTRVYVADKEKPDEQLFNADKSPVRGDYVWETYSQVDALARDVGSGLIALGARSSDNIGLFSGNRSEWVQTVLGLYTQNMRIVALYDTLGAEAVEYISNHANLKIVFTTADKIGHLLKVLPKMNLTHIIQYDFNPLYGNKNEAVKQEHVEQASQHKVELIGYSQFLALGKEKSNFPNLPASTDLALVMYTSGTTGNPKGAMLTHGNIAASIASVPTFFELNSEDRHISYLPLAHIFEFCVEMAMLNHGAAIGFFQNNIKQLTNDWLALRPTILCGVPRVFSRMYQTVMSKVAANNCGKRWYFNRAFDAQCSAIREGKPRHKDYDDRVFVKIRETLGLDKVRGIVTGAAPCPPYLQEFLKVMIGCPVLQGYGMTETSAAITVTEGTDVNVGHCGGPVVNVEVQLRDVEDMGYFTNGKDGIQRGEICVRGPAVFIGYYRDDKATQETLEPDGWMHTGDIGRWNPNGTLSIIDRKKNMFKLSQGEYIAAEKVETEYGKSPFAGQIWVYGNSFKSFLLAVVVPNPEAISNYCIEQGIWPRSKDQTRVASDEFIADYKAVLTGPHAAALKKVVLDSLRAQEKGLKPFERITDIIIEPNINNMLSGFTEANGCLTPTFKLRRPQLLQRYIAVLKETYGKNGEPVGADEKWPGEA